MAKTKKAATQENKVVAALNQQVVDWTVLYTKLHNFHWYVKGPTFFALHEKFEELYTQAGVYVDEIAERILAIGGHPVATLKEAKKDLTAEEMVADLTKDFDKLIAQLKESKETAEEAGDEMTADLFLGIITDLEKHNWMLKSYLV